ncbi:MAG: PEP-CTERM sorting domain-containing protein [Verrucomicrobiaceae bacterium]|nr:MAG: PEP-CTERM sorting domain-containing protein [Verrucomicrobiaceae bacterium]
MKPPLLSIFPSWPLMTASLFLSCGGAGAGTVMVPALVTDSGLIAPPGGDRTITGLIAGVNLENARAGLTPDKPILITVLGSAPPVWTGSISYGSGDLTFALKAILSLSMSVPVLSQSAQVQFGGSYPGITEGSDPSGVLGYQTAATALEFSFTVPWDTDMSLATLNFVQDSSLTGTAGAVFNQSTMMASGNGQGFPGLAGSLTIELTSVPEPGAAILTGLAAGLLVRRRHRIC